MATKRFLQLLVAFVTVFTFTLQEAKSQFYLGVSGDLYGSTITGDALGTTLTPGYGGGLVTGYSFGNFSIEMNPSSNIMGFNQRWAYVKPDYENNVDSVYEYDNSLSLFYLRNTILFKFSVYPGASSVAPYSGSGSKFGFDFMFGPYVAYFLDGSDNSRTTVTAYSQGDGGDFQSNEAADNGVTFNGGKVNPRNGGGLGSTEKAFYNAFDLEPPRYSLQQGVNLFDMGIVVGAGFNVLIGGNSKFSIHGRYSAGFLTMDNGYFSETQIDFDQININDPAFNPTSVISERRMDIYNATLGVQISYVYMF